MLPISTGRALLRRLLVAGVSAGAVALAGPAVAAPGTIGGSHAASPPAVGGIRLASPDTVVRLAPGLPAPPPVSAAGWLVADLDTGQVLAAHDAHGRYAPASTLKILTALTVIPQLDPAAQVLVTPADVDVDGTRVGIVPGHTYTVASLLQAMLMVSGNDAATALANATGGVGHTVDVMNADAAALQAYDTHAATVDGLDAPGQTSSAYDLALLTRAALRLPAFRTDVGTDRVEFSGAGVAPFQIANHNPLLGAVNGVYGVKNGYTVAAQASYVGAAHRGDHDIVVVVMRTVPDFVPESEQLFDWAFAVDGRIAPVGTLVGPAGTGGGSVQPVAAEPRHDAVSADGVAHTSAGGGFRDAGWLAGGVLAGTVALLVGRREQVRRRRRVRLERRIGR
ncbi:MAG TPA: serine hydrolase [Mycobacteriales bacterium]